MQKAEARVAKNTLFLYARMLLILLVNLYTSRVILKTLGFDDYGIYNLVGGLVSLFAFMNSSLSGAASRFIAYSLGEGKGEGKTVFSTLLTIHSIVAVILVVLCETVGILLFDQLVIPESRILAAKVTFHLAVIATAINVIRIPYNASIIAHEDMKVFAYVSVLEVVLKLLIVFLLNAILYDKLITYSWLYLGVTVLISLVYALYCVFSYDESKTFLGLDKLYFKKVVGFFSWDLYGNLSVAANAQGTNIILNLFGGVVVNSACAIANQIRGAVYGFASNFMLAMNPQIVKNYASGDVNGMVALMKRGGIFSFMLLWAFTLPLILETKYILNLWLGEYPSYTVVLTRLALLFSLIQSMYGSVNIGIHATGKIVKLSLIGGTTLLLSVLVSYVALKHHAPLWVPFAVNIIAVLINAFINPFILHADLPKFRYIDYFVLVYLRMTVIAIITSVIPVLIYTFMESSFYRLILVFVTVFLSEILVLYFGILTTEEKHLVIDKLFHIK